MPDDLRHFDCITNAIKKIILPGKPEQEV